MEKCGKMGAAETLDKTPVCKLNFEGDLMILIEAQYKLFACQRFFAQEVLISPLGTQDQIAVITFARSQSQCH